MNMNFFPLGHYNTLKMYLSVAQKNKMQKVVIETILKLATIQTFKQKVNKNKCITAYVYPSVTW